MITTSIDIHGATGTAAVLRAYVMENLGEVEQRRRRPAILLLPGGAYAGTTPREGELMAPRFLGLGYQVFVLRYSCAPAVFPAALSETAVAVRTIRDHADAWHVDPDAIVVAGFSAGGHDAGLFAERWHDPMLTDLGFAPDDIKPNGLLLGYPVITTGKFTHADSIRNLLADRADDQHLLDQLSLERHVTRVVPPTFIWHTVSDELVPVQNSIMFASALIDVGVSVELHLYPRGGHGLALATQETVSADGDWGIQEQSVRSHLLALTCSVCEPTSSYDRRPRPKVKALMSAVSPRMIMVMLEKMISQMVEDSG